MSRSCEASIQQLVGYAPLNRDQQLTPIQIQALGPNWNPAASVEEGFFRLPCPEILGDNRRQHLQRIRDAANSCNETANPCSHGSSTPKGRCSTCGETVLSAAWMVESCGLLRRPAGVQAQMFNFEDRCAEAPGEFFVSGKRPPQPFKTYLESATDEDAVSMCQGSPNRNGPGGTKFASLDRAINRGDGVYGLVQRVGTTMYSVPYYVLFAYNSAHIEEIDVPFFYQRRHHEGDG